MRLAGLNEVGGMKDANQKSAGDYRIGDRLGIDDRHLGVRVSEMKAQRGGLHRCVVSTFMHAHNWLGHFFMAPVGRNHLLVVRAKMRRIRV